jgi:hypothetical protein
VRVSVHVCNLVHVYLRLDVCACVCVCVCGCRGGYELACLLA